MPCDDCSRTETCPPCPYEECKCGHERRFHQADGCLACLDVRGPARHSFIGPESKECPPGVHSMFDPCPGDCSEPEPQGSESSSTDGPRCGECGEPIHFPARTMEAVQRWEHVGHSGHAAVPPEPDLSGKYEEPKPRPCACGPDEACGDPCTPVPELKCVCGHAKSSHDSTPCCIGNRNLCGCLIYRPWTDGPEPPLTPEEEEEAPEDPQCTCGQTACESELCDCDSAPCPVDHVNEELPPPEGPEYTPCVCGHIEPEHEPHGGLCFMDGCDCCEYRTKPDFEPPPQPERRAPYVASYSVGGHLYEVAVPGDACLQAVDGALVIRHGLGPVAGLVGFQPLTVEEK